MTTALHTAEVAIAPLSRLSARLQEFRELLQLAGSGDHVDEILDRIARLIERSNPAVMCSVMLANEAATSLQCLAAPSLPQGYRDAIASVPIADGMSCCGTAAYRLTPMVVEDVTKHPLTAAFSDIKLRYGMLASWSYPIVSTSGTILGTFAIDRRTLGTPSADERELVANAAQLAALVIERSRAEKRRLVQERSLSSILTHALEAIVRVDLNGRFLFANPAAARFARQPVEEIIGKTARELGMNPLSADVHERSLRDAAATRDPVRVEIQLGEVWLSAVSVPEVDETGNLTSFVIVARDITEQRKLEDRIRQAEKMESLGRLAGGIAHDFNNILAAILGYTELLVDDVPPKSEAAENIEQVLHASRRARDLVRQILAFSRKSDVIMAPLDVRFAVRDALRLLRASIPATVEVREQIPETPLVAMSEAGQISQLVLNLGSNAEFAMRARGHGVLDVSLEGINVGGMMGRALGVPPGRYVRLVVRDDGEGIPASVIPKIFEPFFTTKGVGEGTGMGLAVVHGIVSAHGGAHRVESVAGKGTTFEILLPRISTPIYADAVDAQVLQQGSGRVLVVDDERAITDMLRRALPRRGFEVTCLTSPVEAVALFKADPTRFDVVVTDRTMPQMTGETLIRELLAIRPGMPIVLCSGQGHSSVDDLANTAVVSLSKPFDAHELIAAIAQARGE